MPSFASSFASLAAVLLLLAGQLQLSPTAAQAGTAGSYSHSSWSGPALSVQRTGADELPALLVDGGHPSPPLWLNLHLYYQNLTVLDDMVLRAADAGLRTVCVCLTEDIWRPSAPEPGPWFSDGMPLDNRTRGVLDRIVRLHPKVVFIVRLYAQQPALPNMVMRNMTDGNATTLGPKTPMTDGGVVNSLTLEWEASAAHKLTVLLQYLDRQFPGRIGGVFPCFLHTSEWIMPGPNDQGVGGHSKLSDYSAGAEARYCAHKNWRNGSGGGVCHMPLPSQRNHPELGSAFADAETTELNLYLAQTVVHAIEVLAAAAKAVSGGKLMTLCAAGPPAALSCPRVQLALLPLSRARVQLALLPLSRARVSSLPSCRSHVPACPRAQFVLWLPAQLGG